MIILTLALLLSLTANVILVWYSKKLVKNLWNGVNNIDELQNLLLDYSNSLESLYQLEQLYEDENIKVAIANTKLMIEACRVYKSTILKQDDKIEKAE